MDFDQTKRIDVEVSENQIAENEVGVPTRRKRRRLFAEWDILDVALVPVVLGIFVSLGFLFAGLFRSAAAAEAANEVAGTIAAMI